MFNSLTLVLFIIASLAYLYFMTNKKVGLIVKPVPAAILTFYFLLSGNLPMAIIFFFAGIGDYLLIFPERLYWGVVAFTIAYTTLNMITVSHFSVFYLLVIIPMALIMLWIKDGLIEQGIFYPLAGYTVLVILFLLVNSMGHLFHTGRVALGLGLLSLAVSDIFIGFDFARPFKYVSYAIMVTYYAGLILVSGLI